MDTEYLNSAELYYREAFARNIGLLTQQEQEKLRASKVAIVGMGGVGGAHLFNLVRLGVGKFNIADADSFELANIQRQYGAFIDTLGKNKAEVMEKIALSINPHLEINSFKEKISPENIEEFLSGVEILIDGVDFFSIEERRFIFKEARRRGIYTITAGPLGFGSALIIFGPEGMGFDEYFDINDGMSYLEKIVAFGVGLAPAAFHLKYINLNYMDMELKKGPSSVIACSLCGVLASIEVLNILLRRKRPKVAPFYLQFDPYQRKLKEGYLFLGNRNPLQKVKRWYLLKKLRKRWNI